MLGAGGAVPVTVSGIATLAVVAETVMVADSAAVVEGVA